MAKSLKEMVQELGIDKPVMATRVVGNRVELYLYGGEVLNYPPTVPALDLDDLSLKELRALAKEAGIAGYSKMKRDDLIAALS